VPPWLDATFTESNERSPTNLILQVERNAADQIGVYAAAVTISGTASGPDPAPVRVPVRLVLSGPQLLASAAQVTLRTYARATAVPTQPVIVVNGATGTLAGVRVSAAPSWLDALPTVPSPAPTTVLLRADSTLAAGAYAGTVTIASSSATNTPLTLPVALTVDPGAALAVSPDAVTLASVAGDTLPVGHRGRVQHGQGCWASRPRW
jgi:hypothetical protein